MASLILRGAAAVGAGLFVGVLATILHALGFAANEVAGGSAATFIQTTNRNAEDGSFIAFFQSAGDAGFALASNIAHGITGAISGAAATFQFFPELSLPKNDAAAEEAGLFAGASAAILQALGYEARRDAGGPAVAFIQSMFGNVEAGSLLQNAGDARLFALVTNIALGIAGAISGATATFLFFPRFSLLKNVGAATVGAGLFVGAQAAILHCLGFGASEESISANVEAGSMGLHLIKYVLGAATVGAGLFVGAPVAILHALGFGASGIVGGSVAAFIQSMIGNVAAASLFAFCQSVGIAGFAAVTNIALGVTGAIGGAASALLYFL